ncbi:helix-turn-helix transcriptional regulator [Phytoactinopolyspora alkaliphila]|uniref:Helix-turn-helix transcriptional regulator n=1 Tax=Phytoactinopolyspora alkaliphila TaxID=1783498 RepID=A0A6N9YNY9_9ACTN|nr:helix-turn-helix transcriptional regulator [Phytoactinopolyspora alkaliphila]NED96713.1 helix-turn-helix transcriptional regulator [Phytoactinopolyspora alkaliphila]
MVTERWRTTQVAQGNEPVGIMIRRVRSSLGYSQHKIAEQLADASGNSSLTREEVARWERGKRIPGPYWREWLSSVLDVPQREVEVAARVARVTRLTPTASARR